MLSSVIWFSISSWSSAKSSTSKREAAASFETFYEAFDSEDGSSKNLRTLLATDHCSSRRKVALGYLFITSSSGRIGPAVALCRRWVRSSTGSRPVVTNFSWFCSVSNELRQYVERSELFVKSFLSPPPRRYICVTNVFETTTLNIYAMT